MKNATACLRSLVVMAGSIALAGAAQANVLVVAPSGAPYTSIQLAVDAAVDGDTILVHAGTYPGFDVGDKGLAIVADPAGSVTTESVVWIHDQVASRRSSLSGFRIRGGLRATQCAGTLRFEDLLAIGYLPSTLHGLEVQDCPDVAILRSTLRGNRGSWSFPFPVLPPTSGLVAIRSQVALYDSTLVGGRGYDGGWTVGSGSSPYAPTPGAPACLVQNQSILFASGSTYEGGDGGRGRPATCYPPSPGGPGGSGGDGVHVDGSSLAWLLAAGFAPGQGGAGGVGDSNCGMSGGPVGFDGTTVVGSHTLLPGQARVLTAPTHVRELAPLGVDLIGQPGDRVWILAGRQPRWSLDVPFSGVRLVGNGGRRLFLGTMPGVGLMFHTVTFPDLGPGVEAQTWYLQAFFRDTSNQSFHGSAQVVVVLDAAF